MLVFARVSVLALSGRFWCVLGCARVADFTWRFLGVVFWLVGCLGPFTVNLSE